MTTFVNEVLVWFTQTTTSVTTISAVMVTMTRM